MVDKEPLKQDKRFEHVLNEIQTTMTQFPNYQFEYIQSYIQAFKEETLTLPDLLEQFKDIPLQRQEVCFEIFNSALTQAKQSNYHPVNALDAFVEHQIYGIQDDKVVEKGTVSQLLKQYETPPVPQKRPLPKRPGSHPTNPLNPRALPPHHLPSKDE